MGRFVALFGLLGKSSFEGWRTVLLVAFLSVSLAACQAVSQGGAGLQAATPAVSARAEARADSAIVIDASSGRTLFEEEADAPRYPASLTKMMTLYLLFEEIQAGRLTLDGELEISNNAAAQPPAKIGLLAGSTIRVADAAQAIAVRSANDLAVAIAENIAGSEAAFARRMNDKAKSLGMSRTRFVNASGLPDPEQVTSARDMATLGRALKSRFPQYASYFRARSFSYGGRTYEATNKLLGRVAGVDGIKTGYIRLSGYNLVASGNRNGKSLIVVVMGGESEASRNSRVTQLFEQYF